MLSVEALTLFAAYVATIWFYRWMRGRTRSLPLPPGPKRLLFVGNYFSMPSSCEWVTYSKWCKEYNSDIIYLKVFGMSMIVLNTYETSSELLESRSSIYSGRLQSTMVNELMGWDFDLGFAQYGEKWRRHRRLVHHSFHPAAAELYKPQLLTAARDFLLTCLEDPEVLSNLKLMAAKTIMRISYGLDVTSKDDPFVKTAENAMKPVSTAILPGAFLVDMLPILKHVPDWVPGAGFKRQAKDWNNKRLDMLNLPYEAAKQALNSGKFRPSIVSQNLQRLQEEVDAKNVRYSIDEEDVKAIAGVVYTGGADTTVTAISSCILAALEYPEVLRKAQQEIHDVLGEIRLPDFTDMDSLPYCTAVVKEAMRWRPVLPINLPHQVMTDDEYRGYRIPAGSIIIQNAWAMLHDENVYPDPFAFKPERFIRHGKLDPSVRDPTKICFGAGRRICPGRFMAFPAVWITVVSMMAVFDIEKSVDERGNVIEPDHGFAPGIVSSPNRITCTIKPRSKEAEALIQASASCDYTQGL
ncbi:cytochrome P450 [Agrocybe pediades]|nr:cytochrome P450 [Agrocybe pediades]